MRQLVGLASRRDFTRNSNGSTRKSSKGRGERVAVQRTTLYGRASAERVSAADRAAAAERERRAGVEKEEVTAQEEAAEAAVSRASA